MINNADVSPVRLGYKVEPPQTPGARNLSQSAPDLDLSETKEARPPSNAHLRSCRLLVDAFSTYRDTTCGVVHPPACMMASISKPVTIMSCAAPTRIEWPESWSATGSGRPALNRHPADFRRVVEHGGQRRMESRRLVGAADADDADIAPGLDAAGPERVHRPEGDQIVETDIASRPRLLEGRRPRARHSPWSRGRRCRHSVSLQAMPAVSSSARKPATRSSATLVPGCPPSSTRLR